MPLRRGIHGEGGVVLICRLIVWVVVGQHPVGDGLGLAAVGRLRLLGRVGPAPRRDGAGLGEQGRQAVEDGALWRWRFVSLYKYRVSWIF